MKESPLLPEWIDAKIAKQIFSLGRTTLYELASAGRIKTVSLIERGKLRGKRLFSYDSISTYLESRATEKKTAPHIAEFKVNELIRQILPKIDEDLR